MSTPAIEIARYLAEQGVTAAHGGNADWSVHVSREPERPDNVVTIYDTAGLDPLVLDGVDGGELSQPGLQVRVRARGADYEAAYLLHKEIRALLVLPDAVVDGEPLERTIGASHYVQIFPVGDILPLGRDDNDRHILVANYQAIRQAAETAS